MREWGIFVRSFAIQSLWNYRKMQNTGFYFSVYPYFASSLERDKDGLRAFSGRNLGFFNTHPYMASGIAGIAANMEKESLERGGGGASGITSVKTSLSSLCAALGDKFFWGAVRPFLLLLALTLFYLPGDGRMALVSVAVFLALYNLCHFFVRAGFFYAGWNYGMRGVGFLNRLNLGRNAGRIQSAMLYLAGAFLVIVAARNAEKIPLYIGLLAAQAGFSKKLKIGYFVYITLGMVILLHMKGVY